VVDQYQELSDGFLAEFKQQLALNRHFKYALSKGLKL
jgi:hypothetical protein